jgi:hypothetical protein
VYNFNITKIKIKMPRQNSHQFYFSFIAYSLILGFFSVSGLAQSSANYILGGGLENGDGQNISGSFMQDCNQINGGAIGQGSSPNYTISSGTVCQNGQIIFGFRAAPEKRIPIGNLNLSQDKAQINIFSTGGSTAIYTTNTTLSIDSSGNSSSLVTAPISSGQYDISIKTSQHLSERTNNINLSATTNTIDFTNSMTNYLRAGDVNNTGGLGE